MFALRSGIDEPLLATPIRYSSKFVGSLSQNSLIDGSLCVGVSNPQVFFILDHFQIVPGIWFIDIMSGRRIPIRVRQREQLSSGSEDDDEYLSPEFRIGRDSVKSPTPVMKTPATSSKDQNSQTGTRKRVSQIASTTYLQRQEQQLETTIQKSKEMISENTLDDIQRHTGKSVADHLPLLIDSHNRFVDAIKQAMETLGSNGHLCTKCRSEVRENQIP